MRDHPDLPVRRLDVPKRQRLGFLPTMALWNDPEMQRLVFPIIVAASVPLAPLLLYIQHAFNLSTWLVMVATLLYPYLIMGLVERHVRGRPRRPSATIAPSDPAHRSPAPVLHFGVALLFCTMGTSIAALLALGASKATILFTLVLGALGLLGLVLRARQTTRRLAAAGEVDRRSRGSLPSGSDESM